MQIGADGAGVTQSGHGQCGSDVPMPPSVSSISPVSRQVSQLQFIEALPRLFRLFREPDDYLRQRTAARFMTLFDSHQRHMANTNLVGKRAQVQFFVQPIAANNIAESHLDSADALAARLAAAMIASQLFLGASISCRAAAGDKRLRIKAPS
jgi:hypothetical protein